MNLDIPIMTSYFDESVFVDGWIFKNSNTEYPVSVFNRADDFILKQVHGIPTIETCQIGDNNYSLNPVNPCARVNIYSLDNRHSSTNIVYAHKPINVVHDSAVIDGNLRIINFEKLSIGRADDDSIEVFDSDASLTSLESAIMLKFYALQLTNNNVYKHKQCLNITATLYHKIAMWFESNAHQWFTFDRTDLLVRNFNGEYIYRDTVINNPISLPVSYYDKSL